MEIPNFALKWEPKITEFYFSLVLSVNFWRQTEEQFGQKKTETGF